jgi:hypothetical protein
MKNKIILLSVMSVFSFSAFAQNEAGQSTVGANVGYSLMTNFIKAIMDEYQDVEVTSVPTIAVTYDFALTDNFSMGIAGAYQSVSGDFTNTYLDENLVEVEESATVAIARTNIALRPLFHYGGNDQLDMYSGLRVGMLFRSLDLTSSDEDVTDAFDGWSGSRLSVGIVAFGMRYYFSDNVGINMDLQVGTPYVVSAGIAAKF